MAAQDDEAVLRDRRAVVMAMEVRQFDLGPAVQLHRLARPQFGEGHLLISHDLLGSPLPHRDDGYTGLQGQACGTCSSGHRPMQGIRGDRAFRVHDHRHALVQASLGVVEDLGRIRTLPVHRDLTTGRGHPSDDRHREQLLLGQPVRPTTIGHQEGPQHDGIVVGDVVAHDKGWPWSRQILATVVVEPRQGTSQRVQRPHTHPEDETRGVGWIGHGGQRHGIPPE